MNSHGEVILEPEPVVFYNEPLMLCMSQNLKNECTFLFKSNNNDILSQRTLVFDPNNFYETNNQLKENITNTGYHLEQDLSLSLANKDPISGNNFDEMHSTFKNIADDQPEFVDVNNLTFLQNNQDKNSINDSIVVSDDENDVIFVKEYKKTETRFNTLRRETVPDDTIRRNPVRKARSTKSTRHLHHEHLLEEDFDVLDQIDEENMVYLKNKQQANSSTTSNENYKEWPVNAYERPEFNPETKKVEPFDLTIKQINIQQEKKKCYLETAPKIKKKPKKKYFVRKRRVIKVEKKVSIDDLKDTISTTFELVRGFFKMTLENESDERPQSFHNGVYNLFKYQASLFSLVNNFGEDEIRKCIGDTLDQN